MPVIILVRRCVDPDRILPFLMSYHAQRPDDPAFIAEYLTHHNGSQNLPEALRNFPIGVRNAVVFVNVAFWQSVEAFDRHFEQYAFSPMDENETEPRVRAVLDVLDAAGSLPAKWDAANKPSFSGQENGYGLV